MRTLFLGLGAFLVLGMSGPAAADEARAWAALAQGGQVIVMRHASAPGPEQGHEGDPPGFRLDDCSTQRNLSAGGREQAVRLGNMLRQHHVLVTKVMTSPWCRAKDTATLMNLGPAPEVSMLLHNTGAHIVGVDPRQMPNVRQIVAELGDIIQSWSRPGNLLMVSHGRTVVAVAYRDGRVSPSQGEMIVLHPLPGSPQRYEVVGSIAPP